MVAVQPHGALRRQTRRLKDGRGGTVAAVIAYPDGFTAGRVPGVILAHGAGNDMTQPLLVAVHQGLARFFVRVARGVNVVHKAGADLATLQDIVAIALRTLDTARPPGQGTA